MVIKRETKIKKKGRLVTSVLATSENPDGVATPHRLKVYSSSIQYSAAITAKGLFFPLSQAIISAALFVHM